MFPGFDPGPGGRFAAVVDDPVYGNVQVFVFTPVGPADDDLVGHGGRAEAEV